MFELFPSRAIALQIFGFGIHWYGLLYLLSFVVAIVLLPRLQTYRRLDLTRDQWLTIVSYCVLGVIVGGRLGYVFFYEPQYFVAHPLEIFAVWQGGMSFHGGFLGVVLALWYSCKKLHMHPMVLADVVVVPAALGLAFGRVGNFINQELYGTVTALPWAISVPGVDGLRHPTQIYAVLKDLTIALACYLYMRHARPIRPGRSFALFLMLYGIGRTLVEFLREQQYPLTELGPVALTRGQTLSIPLFIAGVILWCVLRRSALPADSQTSNRNADRNATAAT